MAKMGKFDATDLKKFQAKLNKLKADQTKAFVEDCARELAARLLAKVIKRTPVGDYSREIEVVAKKDGKKHKKGETYKKRVNPSGKHGGTLRRGWSIGAISKVGNMISVDVINPVEYASYVEYGHRTRNHKGWVPGRFMLTISEQEIQMIAPNVLAAKLATFLKGAK